jgi:cyclopropane fatty-acyl-phospholipid synthase-like methyltransferase
MKINDYGSELTREEQERGRHREFVGGLWEEIGRLQFDFMVAHGLKKDMMLLDIGCGSFRGGVHFVRYLEGGRYFGMDANGSLMVAGYEQEILPAGLAERLPVRNLLVSEEFECGRLNVVFDAALAVSVFTHLPLNHIHLCLIRLSRCMAPGGSLFASIFECPEDHAVEVPLTHSPGGITTHMARDPYHYRVSDMAQCLRGGAWDLEVIGEWGHPRAQRMLRFRRREG